MIKNDGYGHYYDHNNGHQPYNGVGDGTVLGRGGGRGGGRGIGHNDGDGHGCGIDYSMYDGDAGEDADSPHITTLIVNDDPLTLAYQALTMQTLGDGNDHT